MAQAEIHQIVSVDRDQFFDVITKYEDYPKFVEGCTSTAVDRSDPQAVQVTYHVSMMKEITYTLTHRENRKTGKVAWSLVKSDFFKKNSGYWELKSVGEGKTEVLYLVDVEFKIPVPGLILNRLIKGSLPAMMKNFERQASLN